MESYDDSCSTCIETFATFRIFSTRVPIREITRRLGIEPSRTHSVGDPIAQRAQRGV